MVGIRVTSLFHFSVLLKGAEIPEPSYRFTSLSVVFVRSYQLIVVLIVIGICLTILSLLYRCQMIFFQVLEKFF